MTIDVYGTAACEYVPEFNAPALPRTAGIMRRVVAEPRRDVLQQAGAACSSAGLFLLALAIVGALAVAVVVVAPYFFSRAWLPRRRMAAGCTYCRAGLPAFRTSCPGCGRS